MCLFFCSSVQLEIKDFWYIGLSLQVCLTSNILELMSEIWEEILYIFTFK